MGQLGRARPGRLRRVLAVLTGLAALSGSPAAAAEPKVPEGMGELRLSFAPVVKQAAPAVVNIYARKIVAQRRQPRLSEHPFFGEFFDSPGQRRQRVRNSLGSGVIVSADGLVVTNQHVIEGADEIVAVLRDGRQLAAKHLYSDRQSDIALLKLQDAQELAHLDFGNSSKLTVGDVVLAIGNPFGVGQTTTLGIVSATSRAIGGQGAADIYIQTDAAINPGNSGGALVTLDGKLAGINTAIFSKSGGNQGIGFAIPANLVQAFVTNLENGQVRRPWVGVTTRPVTRDVADSLGLPAPQGVLVESVVDASPADRAGLAQGDAILAIDGEGVNSLAALRYRLTALAQRDRVALTVLSGGSRQRVELPVALAPQQPRARSRRLQGRHPLGGARVANLNPQLLIEFGLNRKPGHVIVQDRASGSPAQRVGLKRGDLLVALNDRRIESVAQLRRRARNTPAPWVLELIRDGERARLEIR